MASPHGNTPGRFAASDRFGSDRFGLEPTGPAGAAPDRAPADRPTAGRTTAERDTPGRAAADLTVPDRMPLDRTPLDRTTPDRTMSERGERDRSAPDHPALDRVAPDRIAPDRIAVERVAMDRIATDRSAVDRVAGAGDTSSQPVTTPLDAVARTESSTGRRTASPGRVPAPTDGTAEFGIRSDASALATTALASGDRAASRAVAEHDRAAESVVQARQPEAQAGLFNVAHPAAPVAAADVPAVLIAPPVTDPAFAAALGEQVSLLIADEISRADMVVSPPDLGPIRIELTLRGDNADLVFTAAAPETLLAIEASAEVLKSMLAERGISLGGMDVGQGRPQHFAGSQGDSSSQRQHTVDRAPSATAGPAAVAATVHTPVTPAHRRGSIDLFA